MLVVIPTHAGDIHQAIALLEWILKLGQNKSHDCLIVADAGTPFDKTMRAREIAGGIFREVRLTTNDQETKGWPAGPYSLFRTATHFVANYWPQPFLILEPDAIPLQRGWLDQIASIPNEQKFIGHIYDGEGRYAGRKFMSGIAVYPADTETRLPKRSHPVHWDVDGAEVMVTQGIHTSLIRHLFGEMNNPPTFARARVPGTNVFDLDWLGDAAIFHRNKDGSLIRLLRRKLFNERTKPNIVVVFPVCAKDIDRAVSHATWLNILTRGKGKWPHEALISFDRDTPVTLVNHLEWLLKQSFDKVNAFDYHRAPFQQYPHAANWAFQNTAHRLAKQDRAWLWMEADAIALKYEWLEVLQDKYEDCGRDWYGPIVPHMGHLQGTSIYPANAAVRMPQAMQCVEQAFDMMSKEIVHEAADANPVMFHMWTLINRLPCPVGGGELPANITADEIRRWLPREAVFLHRVKDNSVLNLLLTGAFRP